MTDADTTPSFAKAFPTHPDLSRATDAFGRGDFRSARTLAEKVRETDANADVRAAASELIARTAPDRAMLLMLALAATVFAIIAGYWVSHAGHPQDRDPSSTSSTRSAPRAPSSPPSPSQPSPH